MSEGISRRSFVGKTAGAVVGALACQRIAWADERQQRYRIGVCDWMILKRQRLGAFQLTKDIGADGVEVDMGSLGERETFDNQLAKPEIRQQFLDKAKELNVQICS